MIEARSGQDGDGVGLTGAGVVGKIGATKRARRLKMVVQGASVVTFAMLFVQIFTGLCVREFSSIAMVYGEEPFLVALLEYADAIHFFHRWAGPVMAVSVVIAGMGMIAIRSESKNALGQFMRPLGVGVIVLGAVAMGFAHYTGKEAGMPFTEVVLTSQGTEVDGTMVAAEPITYLEPGRPPKRQEMYDHHLGMAMWLLLAAVSLQIVGVMVTGGAVPRGSKR